MAVTVVHPLLSGLSVAGKEEERAGGKEWAVHTDGREGRPFVGRSEKTPLNSPPPQYSGGCDSG